MPRCWPAASSLEQRGPVPPRGPNQAVAVAVDRHTGRPVAGLHLRLQVHGRPEERSLVAQARPADEEAFLPRLPRQNAARCSTKAGRRSRANRRRFALTPCPSPGGRGEFCEPPGASKRTIDPFADEPAERRGSLRPANPFGDATSAAPFKPADEVLMPLTHAVAAAESYTQGVEARRRWPDEQKELSLRTGDDGRAVVDLDLSRQGYNYELDVQRTDEADVGLSSHVSLSYSQPKSAAKQAACGSLAGPAGTSPRRNGRIHGTACGNSTANRLANYTGTGSPPRLAQGRSKSQVRSRDGEIWRGPCEVSAAGTFHGRFRIPPGAGSGPCRFSVDGTFDVAASATGDR